MSTSLLNVGTASPIYERGLKQKTNTLKAENRLMKPSRVQFLPFSNPFEQIAKRKVFAYKKQLKIRPGGIPVRVKISRKTFKKYFKHSKGRKHRAKNTGIFERKAASRRQDRFRPGRSLRRQIEKMYR